LCAHDTPADHGTRPYPLDARLSVAVLVDEAPNPSGTGTLPRTPEEITQYKNLVSRAVGLDPTRGDKIEVVSVRFTAPEAFDEPAGDGIPAPTGTFDDPMVRWIAIGAGALLLIGLALFFLLRRKKDRRRPLGGGLDLLIDEPVGPTRLSGPEDKRARIAALRERAMTLAREDLRRLGVVFERWFETDTKAVASEAKASAERPREEAA